MTYIGHTLTGLAVGAAVLPRGMSRRRMMIGFAGEACDEAQGLTAGLRGSLREGFTGNRITMALAGVFIIAC